MAAAAKLRFLYFTRDYRRFEYFLTVVFCCAPTWREAASVRSEHTITSSTITMPAAVNIPSIIEPPSDVLPAIL